MIQPDLLGCQPSRETNWNVHHWPSQVVVALDSLTITVWPIWFSHAVSLPFLWIMCRVPSFQGEIDTPVYGRTYRLRRSKHHASTCSSPFCTTIRSNIRRFLAGFGFARRNRVCVNLSWYVKKTTCLHILMGNKRSEPFHHAEPFQNCFLSRWPILGFAKQSKST